MYLYKIGGGEIIIPTPATHLEMFLAAASGMPISTPVPATREEILWDYIINGTNPQTIIGVPPISFTANGKPLISWSITGNSHQNGTPTPDAPITPDFVGTISGSDWTIPITCAGQTTPVYLGQVSTVRRIKKLVLTGEERYSEISGVATFQMYLPVNKNPDSASAFSNFFPGIPRSDWSRYDYFVSSYTSRGSVVFRDIRFSGIDAFVAWIAQQYATGTPVTLWYILDTPETAIVNEPLCKIGNYADELHSEDAGITIPTVRGKNILTVESELQPSEMAITGYIAESQTITAAKIMARASGMNINDKELESLSKKELNSILKGTVKSDG
jgi:hypothetical protein